MSHSWLQRKRKGELLDLALRANIPEADTLLKDDLVAALEEHLGANESTYAKQPDFSDFYGRSGSPVKREHSSPSDVIAVAKTRRRQTLVKNTESEENTPERAALVTRTPRTVSSRVAARVSEVDIPASPAQLAEIADQSFQVAKTRATELWQKSKIDEAKEFLREHASSVGAIQTGILLIEAVGLQFSTLQMVYGFDVPAVPALSMNSHQVKLPNVWTLLERDWWAPATLWSLTSWILPLIASYFFNLTLRSNTHHKSVGRQSTIDPFTFNIVKALLVWNAFSDPAATGWGPFAGETVGKVVEHIPGGYAGLQIGALVGLLVSLYDAALKK